MKDSYIIQKQAVRRMIGVGLILFYWLIFLVEEGFADVGNYRYFSYRFHEIWSIGYLLVPIITLGWLLYTLVDSFQKKEWKKNLLLILALTVLYAGQWGYRWHQSQGFSTTTITPVKEVVDEYHVLIDFDGREMLLETTPQVAKLLREDGLDYCISFEWYKNKPNEGKLSWIFRNE